MTPRVIILGGYGMLGEDIFEILSPHFKVARYNSDEIDITDTPSVLSLADQSPAWIINCAAYTAVDKAEEDREKAFQVNGYALKNIAMLGKKTGAKVIHFSTDYVFDGEKEEGYVESDRKNPINTYGASKSLGEDLLMEHYPSGSFIIRTAWLYGKNGKNFVYTMLKLSETKPEIKVVNDQHGSPTWTFHLAQGVLSLMQLLTEKKKSSAPEIQALPLIPLPTPGIHHLTNSGSCTWYDFTRKIFELKEKKTIIEPIPSSQYRTPAKRPSYSILKNTKLDQLPNWQEGLTEFLSQIETQSSLF